MEDATKQTITIETPKLINQGTFGCVYKPSFLCDGNTLKEEDYITKIQTKDATSQQEETKAVNLKISAITTNIMLVLWKHVPLSYPK